MFARLPATKKPPMPTSAYRKAIAALFLATLFMGMAYAAILPPFEGFDEGGHYSRIISTAYVAQPPFSATPDENAPPDRVTDEVENYQKIAPMQDFWLRMLTPLSKDSLRATPGFENVYAGFGTKESAQQHTYKVFFGDPKRVDDYVNAYRKAPSQPGYVPSRLPNWEFQHPPLYYMLLAPVARLLAGEPLVDKVILLRLFSFMLAVVALSIAARASFLHMQKMDSATAYQVTAFGILPFVAPRFLG